MAVGHTLQILGPTDENSNEKFQWYRIDADGDWLAISGATRNQVPLDCHDRLWCQNRGLILHSIDGTVSNILMSSDALRKAGFARR